jgi:hypothetical protein
VGGLLTKDQITEITSNTQIMLQIGQEFKNNPSLDSPDKRRDLLRTAERIVHVIKDIASAVQ